jgi:hypothetical protein
MHAAKQEMMRVQRDIEKKEWLKMMSGDRDYYDTPVFVKPPFDPYQFKIEILGRMITELETK